MLLHTLCSLFPSVYWFVCARHRNKQDSRLI